MTEAARQSPMTIPLLELEGVSFSFGDRKVLDGFGVSIPQGEIHGLLGPNGSGKSTALSLLTGLIPAQEGQFSLRGKAFRCDDRSYLEELGVVFQSPSIDLSLSSRENLMLAARLRGISNQEVQGKVTWALSHADLESRADDKASQLSGGMLRRLDIARALLHRPSILLLDEPTSGLDEAAFRATWAGIEKARAERDVTVLVATHRADEAERCDRISVISSGKNIVTDSPANLRNQLKADLIVVETQSPSRIKDEIQNTLGLVATIENKNSVVIECAKGHEIIPKLVANLPDGSLKTVSLRRPTLADVFIKITGSALDALEESSDA